MRKHKKIIVVGCGFAFLAVFLYVLSRPFPSNQKINYGMTFSKIFSEKMNGDWKTAYLALLDDLGVRRLRLAAYWPEIEKTEGTYDFSDTDWQVSEASKRKVEIVLAVGEKLPRWPECHTPEWVNDYPRGERQEKLIRLIEAVINRYKSNASIKMWQVENEPFLPFGECPGLDKTFLGREISLVRSLDTGRTILLTDSGELGTWIPAARRGDAFGTSIYFQVNNRFFGQMAYHLPSGFFRAKKRVLDFFVPEKRDIVIEFQMEPWTHLQNYETEVEEQMNAFSAMSFDDRILFLKKTGFDTAYLWGGEWWYWLKTVKNMPEFWEKGKKLFADD